MKQQIKTAAEIRNQVDREYLQDHYKAVCETIHSYELQLEYLRTEDGRKATAAIGGDAKVESTLNQLEIVIHERKAEQAFLERKMG